MRVIMKKLKNSRRGFTLAETLICVLILLMVSAIVGAAIPTAASVFKGTVDTANAQVLLSTTMTVLRDELSTVKKVSGYTAASIEYFNDKGGRKIVVVPKANAYAEPIDGPGVWVYPDDEFDPEKVGTDTSAVKYGTPVRLVTAQAATSERYVTFNVSSVSDGAIKLTEIKVFSKDGKVLAQRDEYVIRIVGKAELP